MKKSLNKNTKELETFKENVLRILKQKRKNLHWLTENSGLSPTTIYNLEKENFNPTVKTAIIIAQTLKTDLISLFKAKDKPKEKSS